MENIKEQVKDYILLMLGAPVVNIELDENQINLCIDETTEKIDRLCGNSIIPANFFRNYQQLIKEGSLARAMIILGRIRGKYKNIDEISLDGESMYKEGKENYEQWERSLYSEIISILKTKLMLVKDYFDRRFE